MCESVRVNVCACESVSVLCVWVERLFASHGGVCLSVCTVFFELPLAEVVLISSDFRWLCVFCQ